MPNRLKPGPHQQPCRSNIVECYNVEHCFDIVAQNGNIVEATCNKVACCFDIVASVDRALGLRLEFTDATHHNTSQPLKRAK